MARLAVLILALFALGSVLPAQADAAPKKCKRGYVLKTVKKNGKKIKKCVKKKKPADTGDQQQTTPTGGGGGTDTPSGENVGGGGAIPPAGTGFPQPSSKQSGDAAWQLIAPYFVDSKFTDCPGGGWGVTCSVEEVYRHCAGGGTTGQQEYHRYTPTSGSDINSYGSYQIAAAEANPDGSWGVEYVLDSYGNYPYYSWSVAADGTAYLNYFFPSFQGDSDGPERFGPFVWERPSGC